MKGKNSMWQQTRAHFSSNWPIYRQGLAGVVCFLVLWGVFEFVQQSLGLFGLGGIDPAIVTIGWLVLLCACYGHFAGRILAEVKKKQGRGG